MDRFAERDLRGIMGRMALNLGVDADAPVWTRTGKDLAGVPTSRARVGALVLHTGSRTYGNAWAISQIENESGGERTLLRAQTARELANMAYAWCDGFEHRERHGVRS